ncbi:MAG: pyridoxal phosphate-dependent aminotransferase [Treponema sp.]|nr:pyridoxal phosphate-dependent aminotransferase [Treponema sp.]
MKHKMKPVFASLQGGLFNPVEKADVAVSAADLEARGITLMAWADPFFPQPSLADSVKKALGDILEEGTPEHYTAPSGNPLLRELLAEKLAAYNHLSPDPLRNILVTPGSDAGLFFAMLPFISPGDEVLTPDPGYPSNFLNPRLLGGETVAVPLHAEDAFQPDVDEFKKRLSPKTKMVLFCHPNNPTGTVFRRKHLEALCDFIVQNDLILVCDMAFEDLIYDDIELVTPASLPGMWERTLTVFSFSKGACLSGLRVGYIVAADTVMDVLYGSAVNVIGAANTAAQYGAMAALKDKTLLPRLRDYFDRRRRLVYELFRDAPGISMALPESGYLSWLNVSALGDSGKITAHIRDRAAVLVNDGANYGSYGRGWLRIVHGACGTHEAALAACGRIKEALASFRTL